MSSNKITFQSIFAYQSIKCERNLVFQDIVYTHAFYHTLRIFRSTQLLPHYGNNSLGKTGQNQHSVSVGKYFVKERKESTFE